MNRVSVRSHKQTMAASIGVGPGRASVGFRRAGVYREVGFKQGRWVDVGIWQCELNEPSVPPVEPRPFSEIGVVRT